MNLNSPKTAIQQKKMKPAVSYDVVIAGGGSAAVTAAIILGRNMRKVLVCDASHSELEGLKPSGRVTGSDCCCPSEFLRAGRIQLNRLDTVNCLRGSVRDVHRDEAGFRVVSGNGRTFLSKSLLLASDFIARLPEIPDADRFFGYSLHQCPYCDGWEHRGREIGVIGNDESAVSLALKLLMWTPRVTIYTHGAKLPIDTEMRLSGKSIDVVTGSVRSLEGPGPHLESIRMENGYSYPCRALFVPAEVRSHLDLANRLGVGLPDFLLRNHRSPNARAGIQGLFFAGESESGVEMAVSAAADGVKAAEAVNLWLTEADQSYLADPYFLHHRQH